MLAIWSERELPDGMEFRVEKGLDGRGRSSFSGSFDSALRAPLRMTA